MRDEHTTRVTPLSSRADRGDERVRLIEEAVLLMRGDWPGIAMGLCERVNRSVGMIVSSPGELDEAIRETCVESMLLVQQLYGDDAVVEVERMAAIAAAPQLGNARAEHRRRRRLHLLRPRGGIRVHTGSLRS